MYYKDYPQATAKLFDDIMALYRKTAYTARIWVYYRPSIVFKDGEPITQWGEFHAEQNGIDPPAGFEPLHPEPLPMNLSDEQIKIWIDKWAAEVSVLNEETTNV